MSNTNALDTSEKTVKASLSTFGPRSESRKNNFDFLRFFLATLVIYHHSFDLLLGHVNAQGRFENAHPDTLAQFTGHQMDGGTLAVNYFFVISGFLITASWMHSRGLVDYLKKRFLRIYPAFIAALLFCICIIGPLSRGSIGSYFHEKDTYLFLRPLFLRNISDHLPGVFTTVSFAGPVNGSLWTIRYEIVCYLIIAALGVAAVLKKRAVIAVLFLAVIGVYFARSRGIAIPHVEEANLMPRLLTYYLAGTVFYLYRDKIPYSPGVFALVVAGIVVSFVLNISLYTYPLLGTYLLFFIAFCPALRMENFARYGDFSYGTYLYAFPVQQLLIQYMGKSLNPYTLFLLAWLITVPLAAASWYLVEKPFLRLKSRRRPASEPEAVVRTPILYEKPAVTAVEPDK